MVIIVDDPRFTLITFSETLPCGAFQEAVAFSIPVATGGQFELQKGAERLSQEAIPQADYDGPWRSKPVPGVASFAEDQCTAVLALRGPARESLQLAPARSAEFRAIFHSTRHSVPRIHGSDARFFALAVQEDRSVYSTLAESQPLAPAAGINFMWGPPGEDQAWQGVGAFALGMVAMLPFALRRRTGA